MSQIQIEEAQSAAHRAIVEAMVRVSEKSHPLPDSWRGTQYRLLSRLLMRLPTEVSAQEFASTSLWLVGGLAVVRREHPSLAPLCEGLEDELRAMIALGWKALPAVTQTLGEDDAAVSPERPEAEGRVQERNVAAWAGSDG
jgi:hypothetical protein